jgi:hypothetical protein
MTQTQTPAQPRPSSDDIQKLRNLITDIDALAQEGFFEISAIASLALKSLEKPESYRDIENITQALLVIKSKADCINDCIGNEAEQVGCGCVNQFKDSRWRAHDTYLKSLHVIQEITEPLQNRKENQL